ncbi:aldehyde dehydrogenase family protein [Mesoterricola silvestris]|uniref:Aldehyde dehydrogenase n=1 Tax=Mesoterricola silvestris TaxID=2927979 RepID=A0AA48K8W5_9BACT|nr:aldehyde dehydrogenase family protein [Mesoterricola silvestris]BDU72771.1 aldehyde dehydrogenase [Mesoterricola silvestris]
MEIDRALVSKIAERVLRELEGAPAPGPQMGCFPDIPSAIAAAEAAFQAFRAIGLERRAEIIQELRVGLRRHARELAELAVDETGMGRVEDKIKKNLLVINKTPGPEVLRAEAVSGQHGLTLEELAPWGVIGSITPSTNPSETVINNGIGMLSAGNAVVFNAHPGAKRTNAFTIDLMNRLLVAEGAPANLLACVTEPTLESAAELMKAPGIRLLVVTGGPAVVKAAFASGKKVIAGGPGNPPVVVDETADLEQAGRGIVAGASFDNNVVCICEKEVIAVEAIADRLKACMVAAGAHELRGADIAAVERTVVDGHHPHKHFVGKDASHILRAAGVAFSGEPRLIFADVPFDHPFIQAELLMPVIGFTRARDVHEAIAMALKAEHGFRHTASMYSKNIDHLDRMARAVDCSIFVKNGPNFNGLGFEGPGSTSFTIASPTGEGLTNAAHFARRRRCTLKDHFRIV